jgi:hypothetical protein
MANDGDPKSFWQPANAAPAWWQVDFEGRCRITRIHLLFAQPGAYRYRIRILTPSGALQTIAEPAPADTAETTLELPAGTETRQLRIDFESGDTAALAEVEVTGNPL